MAVSEVEPRSAAAAPGGGDRWRGSKQVRSVSHQFQEGLTELFYGSDEQLNKLIVSYGVF
jgi:hypothetical protein